MNAANELQTVASSASLHCVLQYFKAEEITIIKSSASKIKAFYSAKEWFIKRFTWMTKEIILHANSLISMTPVTIVRLMGKVAIPKLVSMQS